MSGEAKRRGRLRPRSAPSHQAASSKTLERWTILRDAWWTRWHGAFEKELLGSTDESSSPSPTVTIGKHGRTCPKCNPSTKVRLGRLIRCSWLSILRVRMWFWLKVYLTLSPYVTWDIRRAPSVALMLRLWGWNCYVNSKRTWLRYALTLAQEGTLSSYTASSGRCSIAPSVSSCACHTKTEG